MSWASYTMGSSLRGGEDGRRGGGESVGLSQ